MDLTNLGFDLMMIAGIMGITQALKVLFRTKEKLLFLDKYLLLFVLILGALAGFIMSFSQNKLVFETIFKNMISYAGGAVLFYQIKKQMFEPESEVKNNDPGQNKTE